MLTETINNISELLKLDYAILPNIITFIVVVIILSLSITSDLELKAILLIYGIVMAILTVLGIDSVFNLFTIIKDVIEDIIELVFLKVITYGN